jgi:hypothetical protein
MNESSDRNLLCLNKNQQRYNRDLTRSIILSLLSSYDSIIERVRLIEME